MSLAKAVFSGKVYREPQKRFTSNDVPLTDFTFNIGTETEDLIRVCAVGKTMSELVEKTVVKGDSLVVEGNMRIINTKTETGAEKRVLELALSSFEKITGHQTTQKATASTAKSEEDIVKFNPEPAEELIGEEEIPF